MGLLEPPEHLDDLTRLRVETPEGDVAVMVDPRLLETRVRDGVLLFSVEGHGRFRLHLDA